MIRSGDEELAHAPVNMVVNWLTELVRQQAGQTAVASLGDPLKNVSTYRDLPRAVDQPHV
jgi:hypothetical protein